MSRKWHKGPPPHIGWWNASINRDPDTWRWWDGTWKMAAFPSDTRARASSTAMNDCFVPGMVEWTTYWPKNARVPRVKP